MAKLGKDYEEQKAKMADTYANLIESDFDSMETPALNISAIRHFLISKIPFYADALQKVDLFFIEKKKVPSFGWTDNFRIYMSLKHYTLFGKAAITNGLPWFKNIEIGTIFVLLHEIGHIVFKSFDRQVARKADAWNIATDEKINEFVCGLMKDAGVFPSASAYQAFMEVVNCHFVLDPTKYGELTSEEVYSDMFRLQISVNGSGLGGDMVGDGKPDKDADGNELSDQEKMSRDIVAAELDNYMQKNASKLAGYGSCTGRELSYLQEPPKISLREVLSKITDRTPDEDWGFGNRQSKFDHLLPQGCRMPTIIPLNPNKVRKVFFVLDSSGSMSTQQINDAINIIRELECKYTKNPIHLIIHTSEIVYSQDLKSFKETPTQYSGGTAFKPVSDEIARLEKEEHILPSVVIWLTDGYGEYAQDQYTVRDFPYFRKLKWIIHGSEITPNLGNVWHVDIIE